MKHPTTRHLQDGIALIMVLVFIVILSSVATFAIKRSILGEGVARNQLDAEVARQAAEAALRDAERDIMLAGGTPPSGALCDRGLDRPIKTAYSAPNFDTTCPRGQCRMESMNYYLTSSVQTGTNPEPWWPTSQGGLWNNSFSLKPSAAAGANTNCNFTGAVPLGTFTGAPSLPGVVRQPEYLIEYMQRGLDIYFRITARGFGLDPNSQVVLQTYFRRGS
jgi:type IV pilus assembly protein PilX